MPAGVYQPIQDDLGDLAMRVLCRVRPGRGDRATAEDCLQSAYVAGFTARARALSRGARVSRLMLMKAMRQAMYRAMRAGKGELRESDFVG